ncbi:type II secretion system F family protein [Caulobacter sp. NIBR2454]|uniref:type II secretion system F family protein n=1 Tax=Caulobacter sp. NIBR2454 TaxID=3015996 RepID=UPI0022B5E651|nr:type II secretion system F family protein [Caulobacter sp. NIBR2454]
MPSATIFITLGVLILSLSALAAGLVILRLERRLNARLETLAAEPGFNWSAGRFLAPFAPVLIGTAKDRREIEQDLQAAGFHSGEALLVFGALRLGGAIVAGCLTWLLLASLRSNAFLFPLMAAGVVYIMAKPGLRVLARDRERRTQAELPFTLDIMLMMIESGVSLDQCFRAIAEGSRSATPIVQTATAALVAETQRGVDYDQALTRWASRLGVRGAKDLAATFRRALAHGTELGPVLREFTREFGERRLMQARESIGRKTAQMTLVMVVFLMPALFIVMAGPGVAMLINQLRGFAQ